MKYFIEIFSPKQAWLDLPKEERAAYLTQVNGSSNELMGQGVTIVSMSENDPDTIRRIGYNFFLIWTFQTEELANILQKLMVSQGWFIYFDQVNLKGSSVDVVEKLINI